MIYKDIIINKKIFEDLLKFKSNKKLPNAFVFHGNDGIGKEAHAIEFFAVLNCKKKDINQACGVCESCNKIKKLQHENLNIIFPLPKNKSIKKNDSPLKALSNLDVNSMEEMFRQKGINPYAEIKYKSANTILINSIREIKKNINFSFEKNQYKVYLILEAEKLCYPNTEAANSLLKILEEPPKNVLFILTTSDISLLLDTIISRCIPIYFKKLAQNKIKGYLTKKYPDISHKSEISYISNGSIKYAIKRSKNYKDKMNILHSIISILINKNYSNYDKIKMHFKNKEDSIELLNLLNLFFRDIILEKTNFTFLKELINEMHINYKETDWEKCILLINNTQKYILKNGQIELMIVSLMLEIKKTINLDYHNINYLEEYLNYQS